ncbi:hypothetical protein [Streptomyces sp. NPDC001275]
MTDSPTTAGLVRSGLDALFRPLGGPGRTVAGPTWRGGGPSRTRPVAAWTAWAARTADGAPHGVAVGAGRTGDAAAPHDELADRARRQEREEPER